MNKVLIIGVIGILLGTTLIPLVDTINIKIDSTPKSNETILISNNGNTLYVGGTGPNNYTRIQDAIDNASIGDTVFVYDDRSPYYENITIYTSINLIGENKSSTVIESGESDIVVSIFIGNVSITGFTIRDAYEGIYMNSNNNQVMDTIISGCHQGIKIDKSENNLIKENIITRNGRCGIDFWYCSNNTITNNIMEDNNDDGIMMWHATYNTIENNVFANNTFGVYMYSFDKKTHNIVAHNSFLNDGLFIHSCYQNTIISNTINHKPLIFLENKSSIEITEKAGQILLINCTNITIQHQSFSNTGASIVLFNTHNSVIQENMFSQTYGITMLNSHNNTIQQNNFDHNTESISLNYCHNNQIISNTMNTGYKGIDVFGSDNNVRDNIIINQNKGIFLAGRTNTIINNTITDSREEGIRIQSSAMNLISQNDLENNLYGIMLSGKYRGSRFNIISNNNIHHNTYGIFIQNAYINIFITNLFMENDEHILGNHLELLLLNIWLFNQWYPKLMGPFD